MTSSFLKAVWPGLFSPLVLVAGDYTAGCIIAKITNVQLHGVD